MRRGLQLPARTARPPPSCERGFPAAAASPHAGPPSRQGALEFGASPHAKKKRIKGRILGFFSQKRAGPGVPPPKGAPGLPSPPNPRPDSEPLRSHGVGGRGAAGGTGDPEQGTAHRTPGPPAVPAPPPPGLPGRARGGGSGGRGVPGVPRGGERPPRARLLRHEHRGARLDGVPAPLQRLRQLLPGLERLQVRLRPGGRGVLAGPAVPGPADPPGPLRAAGGARGLREQLGRGHLRLLRAVPHRGQRRGGRLRPARGRIRGRRSRRLPELPQRPEVLHLRPRPGPLRPELRRPLLGGLVVPQLPLLQPQRLLPGRASPVLRQRHQLGPVERFLLLPQAQRDEDPAPLKVTSTPPPPSPPRLPPPRPHPHSTPPLATPTPSSNKDPGVDCSAGRVWRGGGNISGGFLGWWGWMGVGFFGGGLRCFGVWEVPQPHPHP